MSDLGARLLRHVPLDWLPSLRTTHGRRVEHVIRSQTWVASYLPAPKCSPAVLIGDGERVVLGDPATKGALLQLARALWEDWYLVAVPYRAALADEWRWRIEAPEADVGELYDYATEEEALVEAVVEGRERLPLPRRTTPPTTSTRCATRGWLLQTCLDSSQAMLDEMHGHLVRIAHAAGVDDDQVVSVMVGAIIDRLETAGGGE